MSGMNEFLAQAYGTAQPQQTADAEKVAQAELFAKMAAENGIDLNALNDSQITELWNATFAKTAGEEEKKEHGHKEEKKAEHGHKHHGEKEAEAEALAEWMQTKEAQAKFAEADFFGRQMAHAYVAELRKIASEGGFEFLGGAETTPAGETKEAKLLSAKDAVTDVKNIFKGQDLAKGLRDRALKRTGQRAGIAAGAAGGAAAVGAGAKAVADKDKKKKASALDEVAAEMAVVKAAEAGWDLNEASERIAAVLILGAPEETKVASANTFETAVDIRSLELLEAAGYNVTWEQPQG